MVSGSQIITRVGWILELSAQVLFSTVFGDTSFASNLSDARRNIAQETWRGVVFARRLQSNIAFELKLVYLGALYIPEGSGLGDLLHFPPNGMLQNSAARNLDFQIFL